MSYELMKRRVIETIYPSKVYPPLLVKILSRKNNEDITTITEYVYALMKVVEQSRKINDTEFLRAMNNASLEYGITLDSLTNFTQDDLNQYYRSEEEV